MHRATKLHVCSRSARLSVSTSRSILARATLVVACVAGPVSAKAEARPGRERMYAALRRYVEAHREIPAFARKYGMRCSACHLAVPVLNAYGQAFKDNGYRMKNGTDDLRANEPGYWPVFAWLWKDYEYDV